MAEVDECGAICPEHSDWVCDTLNLAHRTHTAPPPGGTWPNVDYVGKPSRTNGTGVSPARQAERQAEHAASNRFSMSAAREAGNEGVTRGDQHADPLWKEHADAAIDRVARMFQRVTADDVWQYGGLPDSAENRNLGGRMRAAKGRRVLDGPIDTTNTRQKKSHGRPGMNVWRSLICVPGAPLMSPAAAEAEKS